MSLLEQLRAVVPTVKKDEPLSGYTTLRVGGYADYLAVPKTRDDLMALMKLISENSLEWMVVGDGTNLLVADEGVCGVVIKLGDGFNYTEVSGRTMRVGCGCRISDAADTAAKCNLSGLEGVGTVPGTVGGAIVMNAGTHYGYIDAVVKEVEAVTERGELVVLSKAECGFTYRNSRFQTDKSLIVTGAVLELADGDGREIEKHLAEMREHRRNTQPQGFSAGCFFKNAENMSAGQLIDEAGCKGMTFGGAFVSKRHANFIMNSGDAKAIDIYTLAENVRKKVFEKSDIELNYEVRLVGRWRIK